MMKKVVDIGERIMFEKVSVFQTSLWQHNGRRMYWRPERHYPIVLRMVTDAAVDPNR